MLAVALIVCEWESTLSRNTWRRPTERDRRYLTALIRWGYQPSDVERLILDQPDADAESTQGVTECTEGDTEATHTGTREPIDETPNEARDEATVQPNGDPAHADGTPETDETTSQIQTSDPDEQCRNEVER
jgi:hypothetical protein